MRTLNEELLLEQFRLTKENSLEFLEFISLRFSYLHHLKTSFYVGKIYIPIVLSI